MSPSGRSGTTVSPSMILALVLPAIITAALALAYYGYRYTEDVSRSFEASFRDASRVETTRAIEAAEARIDEIAGTFFTKIAIVNEVRPASACEQEPGAGIDSYNLFLDDERHVCTGGRRSKDWSMYKQNLERQALATGSFRYMHRLFYNGAALIAYMPKQTEGGLRYWVAARIQDGFIREELARAFKRTFEDRKRVVVVDAEGHVILGAPQGVPSLRDDRFLFEAPLGKTLYSWRVRVAPADVEALQAQAARQRVFGPALVILATVIIAVGLVVVWLAVRAERRASGLKSDFIANVSHELKTPLSLIRMFGEMVATGRHKGEETAREYGAIITRESERLSHLIDNVLDFARLERGKASYHFAEGDLAEVVERALDVCRYRLEKERMRLATAIEPALPLVRMDENAMTLVVLNLVDNAIKYAAEGGEVAVSLARAPGGVVLTVRDHGPGIDPEELRRIFERFYRARAARERNVRGSGIGLALVKHIAEAHGGRVSVESPVPFSEGGGRGTVFRVHLPAPVAEGSESSERHHVAAALAQLKGQGS